MLQRGRSLFWILAAGLVLLVLVTLRHLPPVVASHFDGTGVPNGWSNRSAYALLLITVGVLLPLGMIGLVHALTRRGPERLSIPARDYWSSPERRHEAVRRVRAYMWWLGGIMAGTALAIHGLILAANIHQPARLSTAAVLCVLGAVLLAIGGWIVGWYRLLRPPTSH